MAIVKAQEFSGPDLEMDEYYEAKIGQVEYTTLQDGTPLANLHFTVLDPDTGKPMMDEKTDEPIVARKGVRLGKAAGPKSFLYQAWSALFFDGKGVPDGTDMDLDELQGVRCRFLWGGVYNPAAKAEAPGIMKVAARKDESSCKRLSP